MLHAQARAEQALYTCNNCAKDISNAIRIKCAVCPDFDLCLECFSAGMEVAPHKSNHAYRVVDNLSFPVYDPGVGRGFEGAIVKMKASAARFLLAWPAWLLYPSSDGPGLLLTWRPRPTPLAVFLIAVALLS